MRSLFCIIGILAWSLTPNLLSAQNLNKRAQTEFKVVFSPAPSSESHLEHVKQWIDQAQSSIDIAMYSMSRSSSDIIKAIQAARSRQVRVRLLFETANSDSKSPEGTLSSQMEDLGVDVRYINKIMHHKFALIDARGSDLQGEPRLITGSANWTPSAATFYDENTVFVKGDLKLIQEYRREFDNLWAHSRDFSWAGIESDLNTDPILLDTEQSMFSKAAFTSDNFRVTTSRYGYGFTEIQGRNTVSDEIVAQIKSARKSIKIASGHFRSHPIATALLQAMKEQPELDIQVYLDNQEYISYSGQLEQKQKRELCLESADSASATEACYDRGYYYSYEAQAAGISLRFKSYAYRWHYSYAPQMHHKYLIIDDHSVVTGSYNFSDNAEHATMENILIVSAEHAPGIVADFVANFTGMWDQNRDALPALQQRIQTSDTIPLVFPAMALNWSELTALKRSLVANCKPIHSDEFRKYPEKHTVCMRN